MASRIPAPGLPGGLGRGSRFLLEGSASVIVLTTRATDERTIAWLRSQGARVHLQDGPRVDLAAALRVLADRGLRMVMVEGGGTLVAALIMEGLVDELRLYVAAMLLGGATAPTPMEGPGLPASEALPIDLLDVGRDEDGGVRLRYALLSWEGPRPYDQDPFVQAGARP